MKRNVLRKFKKNLKEFNDSYGRFNHYYDRFNHPYGRYVFLVIGVLIVTIVYICSQNNETNTVKAEEKAITQIYPVNPEEAENSQIGYIEKEIDTSKEYFSGMSARIAHLDEPYVVQATISENEAVSAEEDDILLLEKTVYAEARGEPEDGQIAVINVIMNRVKAPEEVYPNSVHDVVFDRRFGAIQFECAANEEIWAGTRIVTADDITENLEDAVMKALSGENTIGDRTNFHRYNPEKCNHENQIVIGNHVFY